MVSGDKDGLRLNTPFKNLRTNGFCPAGMLSMEIKDEMALRAVFNALKPRPDSNNSVRKSRTDSTFGLLESQSRLPQNQNHLRIYEEYCRLVLFLQDARRKSLVFLEISDWTLSARTPALQP